MIIKDTNISEVIGAGTAASKNVPATGNASSSEVVLGSDTRLSNSRTPTSHASTHVTGGGDVIPDAISGGNSGLLSGSDKAKLERVSLASITLGSPGQNGFATPIYICSNESANDYHAEIDVADPNELGDPTVVNFISNFGGKWNFDSTVVASTFSGNGTLLSGFGTVAATGKVTGSNLCFQTKYVWYVSSNAVSTLLTADAGRAPDDASLISWSIKAYDSSMNLIAATVSIDVYKASYANWPGTLTQMTSTGTKPSLTTSSQNQNSGTPNWNSIIVSQGDFIGCKANASNNMTGAYMLVVTMTWRRT